MTLLLETPVPAAVDNLTLRRGAARVLFTNWTGSSTVPSRGLYPHQWSWDSAFIAIGLRHLSVRRAQRELETLVGAQWADGRIPHIVFNPAVPLDAYFPSPDFWRSSRDGTEAGAPASIETSGIVQPPYTRSPPGSSTSPTPRRRVAVDSCLACTDIWRPGTTTSRAPATWEAGVSPPWCIRGSPAWTTALAGTVPCNVSNRQRQAPTGAPTSTTDSPRSAHRSGLRPIRAPRH